ncbi:heat shock protein HtpX [Natrialba aegyptia DSM 13077]|uniref:Heat shock protein HtpX n=2 Tax=Natrialba aegyptia TaxID=129789 RepID=M0BDJ8_9EURY|nr:heat shock protein HtpX [Natrialba aegyptia DSM 13077]
MSVIQLTRFRLGLWLRMAVALILVTLGQLTILAVEFVIVAICVVYLYLELETLLAIFFVFGLVFTCVYAGWIAVTKPIRWLYPDRTLSDRIAHDGVADAVESVGEWLLSSQVLMKWQKSLATLLTLVVGLFLGFAVVESTDWRAAINLQQTAVLVGVLAVLALLARVVYGEWTDDAAALRELEDSARVPEDPAVELAAQRAAVQARVDRLARQVDVPSPTVVLGTSSTPIAATAGYRPTSSTVVISRGLVDVLEADELDAVLAHELAHVQNRDAAVVTILSVPAGYAWKMVERYEHGAIMILAGAVLAAVRWSVAIVSRYREYCADEGCVAITGDPASLASALETLDTELEHRPAADLRHHDSGAAFSIVPPPWEEHRFFDRTRKFIDRKLLGTHPPTENRIERLRTHV